MLPSPAVKTDVQAADLAMQLAKILDISCTPEKQATEHAATEIYTHTCN